MIEALPLYEAWDLQASRLPRRSHLYSLQPIGLGTGAIESLSSYVARLAALHQVSVRTLLDQKLLLLLKPPKTFAHHLQAAETWLADTPEVAKLVNCLRRLTLRQDLHQLTLLPWQPQLSTSNVFHEAQPFCSACYEEDRDTDGVYDPLLWSLSSVKVCLRHQRYLYLWCMYCGSKQPFLRTEVRPGYCSHCRAWLGMKLAPFEPTQPQAFNWHLRVAQTLGQQLQSAWSLPADNITANTICPKQAKAKPEAPLRELLGVGSARITPLNRLFPPRSESIK